MAEEKIKEIGRDDWLAKELEREKRVSFWDLDEGKKVRAAHEENCEAREVAEKHHERHQAADDRYGRIGAVPAIDKKPKAKTPTSPQDTKWLVIDFFFLIGLIIFNNVLLRGYVSVAPILILFLGINPGIFFWLAATKKIPPAWYSILILMAALGVEIYQIIYHRFWWLLI